MYTRSCSVLAIVTLLALVRAQNNTNVTEAKLFLKELNLKYETQYFASSEADWNYATNITEATQQASNEASLEVSAFLKEVANNASEFAWQEFPEDVRRQFEQVTNIGTAAMKDTSKLKQLTDTLSQMETTYSTAQVCLKNNTCYSLEPGITNIMASSNDYDELRTVWKKWRDASGKKIRQNYIDFVRLSNEAIREAGYNDTGEYWRSAFKPGNFREQIEALWQGVKPLYQQLHAYVRRQLMKKYAKDKFPASGHIPAHIVGNMWAQSWGNLNAFVRPFKNETNVDVTDEMKNQNYNASSMFHLSDDFFASLGLIRMPQTFWDKSMIVRPEGRKVVCHASAWDFYNKKDFRIKMCTRVNMEDLITIHHEMGHIEYYLQYKEQPAIYRDGANPGFHEAIGDTLALSVSTPEHLQKIGLLKNISGTKEFEINYLMSIALDKIAFLPFGYLIDLWRWNLFSGETTPENMNEDWWRLRCKYQGIYPPVKRSEKDFDPGAKYHIPSNTPYIRYFVSAIVQFQFHKALCDAANHTGPLYKCDIYKSKEAGNLLSKALKLGSSKPWPDVLKLITGSKQMSTAPLMDYFKPLHDWLKKENKNQKVTWKEECPIQTSSFSVNYISIWCLSVALITRFLFW